MNKPTAKNFVEDFTKKHNDWINSKLINHSWPDHGLFHYTSSASANAIVKSQIFHASFITTTSDPLEFTLPMVSIRNWITTGTNLLGYEDDSCEMIKIFKFFNDESRDPTLRPYFISLCDEKKMTS